MKILNASQVRDLDAYTIAHEPVSSIDLMERAALTFVEWFTHKFSNIDRPLVIFCGPGNNGGDGLAVARLLYRRYYTVKVYECKIGKKTSSDYNKNLERLVAIGAITLTAIHSGDPFPPLPPNCIIIDGIFGSGLNRPVEGYWGSLLDYLSKLPARKVAIDIPSGLFADQSTSGAVFEADHTFSFELPKLAFMLAENASYVGAWEVGSIGLHRDYLEQLGTANYYVDMGLVAGIYKKREKFSHKGTFGHALLICGSYGKMGAAVLAAGACLRSGVGLLTLHIPRSAYGIMQISVPEAMVELDPHEHYFSKLGDTARYQSIGVGSGIDQHGVTAQALETLIEASGQPLVMDADALNLISKQKALLKKIPKDSILTPHPKEFERLFGKTGNDFERLEVLRSRSKQFGVFIVLKGAHTCIATPTGHCYFNSTGNPGMATAGSGDVLTGIISGLLAQKYNPFEAAVFGVYLHGLAGDLAARQTGYEAMLAGDIIKYIGAAYKNINSES